MKETVRSIETVLKNLDFDSLPISDYNKQYIRRIQPALSYYLKIYAYCLTKGLAYLNRKPADIVFVDYGGGSGFLSILAKSLGIGTVIYVDINPLSAKTISILKEEIGIGPDVILQGGSDKLVNWCNHTHTKPQLLIATDLIEHVYDLSNFFADLLNINKKMFLLFTTASNPYNPIKKKQLHRYMQDCENGSLVNPNYSTMRTQFIKEKYPHMTDEHVSHWSQRTRGLIYEDIQKAIETNMIPPLSDANNTCNPETGNWAERILPIQAYKELVAPHDYILTLYKGFYNTQRTDSLKLVASKTLNFIIKSVGKAGFRISPFIVIAFSPKETE